MTTYSYSSRNFWIFLVLTSALSIVTAWYYFPSAIPLVNVNIEVDRDDVLLRSKTVIKTLGVGPENARTALSFTSDDTVKTFVELEGGGKQAFIDMFEQDLYQPYTWRVRLFKEGNINETTLIFTPDGHLYGFSEQLSEDEPGTQLKKEEAQKKAEELMSSYLKINLSNYFLLDASQDETPSKRVDHTFVYQMKDKQVGDGFYRIRAVVAGDKVTQTYHFVKVPEAFLRRYANMRASNDMIAYVAKIIMLIAYIICGCLYGILFLYRKHALIIRPALIWAGIIATLNFINTFNELPSKWFSYNTALSQINYLSYIIISALQSALYSFALFSIIFIAAEGLTRLAFGSHIQFWKLWQNTVASSTDLFGRTIGAYLVVPFKLTYVVLFTLATSYFLGWWMPANNLVDPDLLANYIPWLESISKSLQAGFYEECLFRAIPLASAALIGRYYKKERTFIILGMILQALVFGAAHANYPMQPAYSRVVELFFSSLLFGYLYLRFGLLVPIITHFVYDVFWFSLPIFISTAQGVWFSQTIVIVLSLVPFFVLLFARVKEKMWHTVSHLYLNAAWQPKPIRTFIPRLVTTQLISLGLLRSMLVGLGTTFLVMLPLWYSYTSEPLFAQIKFMRSDAIEAGKQLFTKVDSDYMPLSQLNDNYYETQKNTQRFIWQTAGKKSYKKLLGSYIYPPSWLVRYARFSGNVVERAKEYKASISALDGSIMQEKITLPETESGATLSEEEAYTIAIKTIKDRFGVTENNLIKLSVDSDKKPNRLDWQFIFEDKSTPLSKGRADITVELSGDQVTDTYQSIHIPEQWQRQEQNRTTTIAILKRICGMLFNLFFIVLLTFGFIQISKKRLFIHFLGAFASLVILYTVSLYNGWYMAIIATNTSKPFWSQVVQVYISSSLYALIKSALIALGIVIITRFSMDFKNKSFSLIHAGIVFICGASYSAFVSLINCWLTTDLEPAWPSLIYLNRVYPLLGGIIMTIINYFNISLIGGLLYMLLAFWYRRNAYTLTSFIGAWLLLFISFIILTSYMPIEYAIPWFTLAALFASYTLILYLFYLYALYSFLPLLTAGYLIAEQLPQIIRPSYQGAQLHGIIASIVVLGIGCVWSYLIFNYRSNEANTVSGD